MLAFDQQPLWIVAAVFAVAATLVWGAGTRLARYLDRIARRTGVGAGLLGVLVLGSVTSLPEAAIVTSASIVGNAPLAVNNLLGSAAINVVLLAAADAFIGDRALTSVVRDPTPILQGALAMILLAVVAVAIIVGDVAVSGVGLWSTSLVFLFVFAAWLTSRYEHRRPWSVADTEQALKSVGETPGKRESRRKAAGERSIAGNVARSAAAAVVILAAGYLLAQSGDAIAKETGIGSGLVGLVLVGFATSLTELSSIISAVKLERYQMALGDIFGTNIFNIVLIFVADLFFSGPPIFNRLGPFEAVATLLAIVLTGIYLVGLLERRDQTLFRMGYASLAVILVYLVGIAVLYGVHQQTGA